MIKQYKTGLTIRNPEEFRKAQERLRVCIPFDDTPETEWFLEHLSIGGNPVPNRFCIQPMEGCDGDENGNPSELTFRKYRRFAQGGAGIIWVEATAVVPEGRANPRQLWIHEGSLEKFRALVRGIREHARNEHGERQRPFLVLQLTHSGRYSKPEGEARPMIMHHSPVLDPTHGLGKDYPLVTDAYLDDLLEHFVQAAKYAAECGFDGVDIKSCHGYLLHEMLSAHTRMDSRYAGNFDNRTRFFRTAVQRVMEEVCGIVVTSRLSIYDAYPHPYGWGMEMDGSDTPDLTEPLKLLGILRELGVSLINVCIGNPYYNPHVERPYDFPIQGFDLPKEHPLVSLERNINLTAKVAEAFPDMLFVSSGTSWLRQMSMHVGNYMLKHRHCHFIGLGRMGLAYPDFPRDFLSGGAINPGKACIACSSCTQMMRDGMVSGCVIRDSDTYASLYYQGRLRSSMFVRDMADSCRNCWGGSCNRDCPAGMDVSGFIREFYQDRPEESYRIMIRHNRIPEVCSHICPSEVLCENSCTARILNRHSVPVREIQKHITTLARERGWTRVQGGNPTGKKAAIIGLGPAGLACAVTLVEAGIHVTVYEERDFAGGTAEAVIPYDRLPAGLFKKEADSFRLGETGLFDLHCQTKVSGEFSLDHIFRKGADAIFIGAGLGGSIQLDIPSKPPGVLDAMDFLHQNKTGGILLNNVKNAAVVGGGNTAMDVAMSLSRKGIRNVYLIYRRSFQELPAWEEEIRKAMDLGVHFLILSQPVAYLGENNLTGIRLSHTVLGEPDESGRPRPVILSDSEYVLPVDVCIEAIGQKVSSDLLQGLPGVALHRGLVRVDREMRTSRERVYAGGDIVSGGMTVVRAAGEGRMAAETMIRDLGEEGLCNE